MRIGTGWLVNEPLKAMTCWIFSVGKSGHLMAFQGKE
jgi:hypothetical protein